MKSEAAAAQRGRPRAFDPDAALERAMHGFWAKGYEGASLSDLTRAMRINRPSLYAAFGTARMTDDPRIPAGCLMVQGALACGDASVRKEVAARRAASEVALRHRLQRAKREGDLPRNADPAELACYVMTVVRGMAVQSAGGAGRAQLRRVAQIALRALPKC